MIFPQLGPQYYEEKDRAILSRMEAFYSEAITINQAFWSEAFTDTRFFCNDQSLWNDLYGNLPVNRRRQFSFNRIRRIINMISGYQRRNRMSTIVVPVENGDAETADQFTKVFLWLDQQEGVLETISEAFEGALITGLNFLEVWMDYRSDPINGDIKVNNCTFDSFLVDPYFKKLDFSDCNAIWKRTFLTKRQTVSLLPDREEEILGLTGGDNGTGRDGKFQFQIESYNYGMKDLLSYDNYCYRDFRTQKLLANTKTGATMEWRSEDADALKYYLKSYPEVALVEQTIPTVRQAIVVQGRVMYHGPQVDGLDMYPYIPVVSYYSPELADFVYRLQGVVRGLRDSQYLYNRLRIIQLDIIESQINSGWKYKENALVNPKDIFLQGQGKGLALKEEAQMTDVEKILPTEIPASMIQLSELLAKEVTEVSGVNEELLGSAIDDKAGILAALRQGAGLTTLQTLFDKLNFSQKQLGKVILQLIQTNFTPGKVRNILEGKQPTGQFYNKAFGKYGIVVEEGLNTITQKQMQFAQLLQLRELGVPIPDDMLLEASTLQNKKELVEAITRNQQQAQQMQQQQAQAAMQEQMARINLSNARAQADTGLYLERSSRVQENEAAAVERKHAAVKDDQVALLNLVKALKEIDTVDLEHIEKLLALANAQVASEVGEGAANAQS